MQKFDIFVKKNGKTNIWEIKNIVKLEITVIIQGNVEVLCICNLKYSVLKKAPIAFHNGSNYDYQFYHERVTRRIWKTIYLFRRKHWKKKQNRCSSNRKRSYKNWWKLRSNYKKYILQIPIYWLILVKEFIKLNVNLDMMIKNVKLAELKIDTVTFKDDLIEYKCLCCNENYKKQFDERLKKWFWIYTNFLTMITISLFYCCRKV